MTDSKSTDKLRIIYDSIKNFKDSIDPKTIKKIAIDWKFSKDGDMCPTLEIEIFET